MKKLFEHLLTSILLITSIILGLTFWLNIKYSFNLLSVEHWTELSRLQASHTHILPGFYISLFIATFILILGLYVIFRPKFRKFQCQKSPSTNDVIKTTNTPSISEISEKHEEHKVDSVPAMVRPPRLNIPKNIIQFNDKRTDTTIQQDTTNNESSSKDNHDILIKNVPSVGYIIKDSPTVSGFTPDIIVIGHNETIYIGGINPDVQKLQKFITNIESVFSDTLEDIEINVIGFSISTNLSNEQTDILTFNTSEEFGNYLSQQVDMDLIETDKENFEAYSEYIDTVLSFLGHK